MRRMTEYQEAEREAEKEVNRTGAAPESESGAAEEQSTRRTRQAVLKRPWAFASKGERSQKKAIEGSEAGASTQVPEIIPLVQRSSRKKKKRR